MTTELDHADIRWRVSNTWDKGNVKWGMLVGYIDSRTAMEALDALDPNWSSKMEPIALGGESGIRCTLIVNGVAREDVGVVSNIDALKGAFSDALKRAAVHFGIGRELYELPKIAVECEVGATGKVKAPKALPTFRNGRWEIDRQFGWVKYEREPNEQSQDGERASASGGARSQPATTRPAAQRTPEEAALLDELAAVPGMTTARASLLADAVGVPKGQRANAEQLREMLARTTIELPSSEAADAGADGARASAPADTPPGVPTDAAPAPAPATPLAVEPESAPTDDEILAVTGGEMVTPKARTVEEAIADAEAKSKKAKVPA